MGEPERAQVDARFPTGTTCRYCGAPAPTESDACPGCDVERATISSPSDYLSFIRSHRRPPCDSD